MASDECFVSAASLLKKSLFAAQTSFFDDSKARFTANSKLAPWAQTVEFAVVSLP